MADTLYFAYGSNLLRERLLARCPAAIPIGHASLSGHQLGFGKPSVDRSGKATLVPRSHSKVFGVLWSICSSQLRDLDRLEGCGKGYERSEVKVVGADETATNAMAYMAAVVTPGLKPYDWYLALVIAGARQQGLPKDYVGRIERVESLPDPFRLRRARRDALDILRRAGFQKMAVALDA